MRLTFFLAVLLVFARCSASKQLDFCSYDIPSTDHAGYCLNYDLSKLASLPGVSFSVPGSYNYTFSVCGDVVDLPAACEWKEASPAYQYSSSGCYALGQLNSSYVVSGGTWRSWTIMCCYITVCYTAIFKDS